AAQEHAGRAVARREPLADAADDAGGPLRRDVSHRDRLDLAGPVAEARREGGLAGGSPPRSPRLATRAGGEPSGAGTMRRIHRSNASRTAASSAKTSGWSHSADVRIATAGRYGSKLPAYSSASTTNGPSRLPSRAVDGTAESQRISAPTNAVGSSPARARTWTSHPAVVLLP